MTEKQNSKAKDILEILQKRWSPRAFSDQPVDEAILGRLFESARWSASCYNEQPWRFIVGIKGRDSTYESLLKVLVPGNQVWASTAPVLVLICAKTTFSHNGQSNDWYKYDAGQAAAYITVQAMSEGVFVHQMAGFQPDEAMEDFSIPDDFVPVTAIALGYPGDPNRLPENLRKLESPEGSRKSLSTMVFEKRWENSSDIAGE